ncbi:MAG: gamma carbonic anhydrase family protein [Rhodoglobus sp.]
MALIVAFGSSTPAIPESAWVAPNATLIGAVTLGERASVYYGAVLRGDINSITIGEGSNVQDLVAMHVGSDHPLRVGDRVSIGHAAVLHGCTIGDDCLVGMSATVLNGAVVGAGSLVAAGAVVLEGSVIPPRSLVAGVPGRVKRELTDAEFEQVKANAEHYLAYTQEHRAATS